MTERNGSNRAIICRAGPRVFALAGNAVREVCTDLQLIRMPGVAAPVEGVFNLRGTLITVVRAGGEAGASGDQSPSHWCVVIQRRDGRVALGVDDVLDYEVPGPGIDTLDADVLIETVFGRGAAQSA